MSNIFDNTAQQTTSNPLAAAVTVDVNNKQQLANGNWTPVAVPFCLRVQTYSIKNT